MTRTESILSKLLDLLYVPTCVSCGEKTVGGVLCPACFRSFEEHLKILCPDCGKEYGECTCVSPALRERGIHKHYKLFRYDPLTPLAPENRMLYRLKNYPDRRLNDYLAERIAEKLPVFTDNTYLTYMPRSRKAFLHSGLDQGKEFCMALAPKIGVECKEVFSHLGNRTQKMLTRDERILNAEKSYKIRRNAASLIGKTVILYDDVSTSGATLASGVKLLKKQGVRMVFVLSLAVADRGRTVYTDKK